MRSEPPLRPRLAPGDVVAVVSPAAPLAGMYPARTHRGIRALEALGLRVRVMPNALGVDGHVSAVASARAADIEEALGDPVVRAVLASAGGWNSNAVLELVDADLLRRDPKVVCGYSDTTALLLGLWSQAGVVTFYGPSLLPQFAEAPEPHPFTVASWCAAVGLAHPVRDVPAPMVWTAERQDWHAEAPPPRTYRQATRPRALKPGSCRGTLVAAHLSTLCALVGTQHMPDLSEVILCLEQEDGGSLGELERDLVHLDQAGVLATLAGVVIGRFAFDPGCGHADGLLAQAFANVDGPVAVDAPFGHTDPVVTLPLGVRAELAAPDQDGDVRLRICP